MEQTLLPVTVEVTLQLGDPAATRHRRAFRVEDPERRQSDARHGACAVKRPSPGQGAAVVAQQRPRRVELGLGELCRDRGHRPQHHAGQGTRECGHRELTQRGASLSITDQLVAAALLALLAGRAFAVGTED